MALSYLVLVALHSEDRDDVVNSVLIYPSVGVVPLAFRLATGGWWRPAAWISRVTRWLHLLAATVLGAIGLFWLITVYVAVLSPLSLTGAVLSAQAASAYRTRVSPEPDDPRLGFVR